MKKLGIAVMFVAIIIGQLSIYIGSANIVVEKWKESFNTTITELEEIENEIAEEGYDDDWESYDKAMQDDLYGEAINAELYAPMGIGDTGLDVSITRAAYDKDAGLTIEFMLNNNSNNEYDLIFDCLTLNHASLNQSIAFNDITPGFSGVITKYISGRELDEYSIDYSELSKLEGVSYLYNANTDEYIFNMDDTSVFNIIFNNGMTDEWVDISYSDGSEIYYEDITITADQYINDNYGEAYRFLVSNQSLTEGKGLLVRAQKIEVNGIEVDGYCSIDMVSNSYGYAYLSLYDEVSLENSEISVVFDILDLPTYSVVGTTDEIIVHT